MKKVYLLSAIEGLLLGAAVFFFFLDKNGGPEGLRSKFLYAAQVREYHERSEDTSGSDHDRTFTDGRVGFLTVEGTNIEYPVMRDISDSYGNYFYLTHNYLGETDPSGCPFIRRSSGIDDDILEVFAHNNSNGTMFADLEKFEEERFFNEYGIIRFDTGERIREYHVISVFDVPVTNGGYTFFGWSNFPDEDTERDFIEQISSISLFPSIRPDTGSEYLVLITCEYSHEDGRRCVVAVRTL